MSTDQTEQTIIAWKHDDQSLDNNSAHISEEDHKIQCLALDSDGAEEVVVTHNTGSRNVSIGSLDEAGALPGVEDDRKTVGRLKKTSLCSTLSSGDQPYLSLISSEREEQVRAEVADLVVFQAPTVAGKSLRDSTR